jgi:hypothetical protein
MVSTSKVKVMWVCTCRLEAMKGEHWAWTEGQEKLEDRS